MPMQPCISQLIPMVFWVSSLWGPGPYHRNGYCLPGQIPYLCERWDLGEVGAVRVELRCLRGTETWEDLAAACDGQGMISELKAWKLCPSVSFGKCVQTTALIHQCNCLKQPASNLPW